MSQSKAIALIIGAGDHLGSAIARRFARESFHIVATRRRGDLSQLTQEVEALGSSITALHSDARDEQQVSELIERVESELGPSVPLKWPYLTSVAMCVLVLPKPALRSIARYGRCVL